MDAKISSSCFGCSFFFRAGAGVVFFVPKLVIIMGNGCTSGTALMGGFGVGEVGDDRGEGVGGFEIAGKEEVVTVFVFPALAKGPEPPEPPEFERLVVEILGVEAEELEEEVEVTPTLVDDFLLLLFDAVAIEDAGDLVFDVEGPKAKSRSSSSFVPSSTSPPILESSQPHSSSLAPAASGTISDILELVPLPPDRPALNLDEP
mmetsp:Transcript_21927/g.28815  ORF Transcript_21927/g.28815 Transcript_21927/m.28815 type:complete len:204 (-) Transcript_21927:7-618(-)